MLRVPKQFIDQVLWPEFKELSSVLAQYLDEVTTRLIRDEVHGDTSEAHEIHQNLLKPSPPRCSPELPWDHESDWSEPLAGSHRCTNCRITELQ